MNDSWDESHFDANIAVMLENTACLLPIVS